MKRKSPQSNPEFERFKEFTRKLIAVPKKEIDRQKATYEKKKQRNGSKRKAA
jgi:hypothetical protein